MIPLLSEAVPEVHTVNGNEESKTVIHTVNESLAPETVIHTVNVNEESVNESAESVSNNIIMRCQKLRFHNCLRSTLLMTKKSQK